MPTTGVISGFVTPKDKTKSNPLARQNFRIFSKSEVRFQSFPVSLRGGSLSLRDKNSFYSELNKEGVTDEEYEHAQKVWEVLKIKNLGEYHELYVQSDTLLLVDVFENFTDKCIEIYEPDPAHFLSAPRLAWQACLKKTWSKIRVVN